MRAALFQMTSGIDPAANAAAIVAMMTRAKGEGADMLFTPEMAGYLDRDRARAVTALRCQADDVVLAAVREAAAREGLWVHIGSLPLKDERADGRWANRSFLIDDTGAIRAIYDKIHLFDVDLATAEIGDSLRLGKSKLRSSAVPVDNDPEYVLATILAPKSAAADEAADAAVATAAAAASAAPIAEGVKKEEKK